MGISNGVSTLHRVALEVNGVFYYFKINPQNIVESFPARNVFTKTEGDPYMQGFGSGIHTIQISGNTGWGHGNDGYNKYVELKNLLMDYNNNNEYGLGNVGNFYYHDFTNGYSWQVELNADGFKFTQSVDRPLLYDFDISMVVISPSNSPVQSEISYTTTGNVNPSLQTRTVRAPLGMKYTKNMSFNTSGLPGQDYSEEWNALTSQSDMLTSTNGTVFNPRISETAGLFGSISLKKVMGV